MFIYSSVHTKDTLSKILQGIKGVSAKMCNALLNRTGQRFWQEESFDHIVRSEKQFQHFIRYIIENPVKAKLREGEFSQFTQGSPAQGSPDNPVGDNSETGLSRLPSTAISSFDQGSPDKQGSPDNPVGDNSETGLSRLPSTAISSFVQSSPDKQGSPDNPVGEGETETGLSRLPSVGDNSATRLSRLPSIGEDKTPRQDCLGNVSSH